MSIQNVVRRSAGCRLSGDAIKHWKPEDFSAIVENPDVLRAVGANLRVGAGLDAEIADLEKLLVGRVRLRPS